MHLIRIMHIGLLMHLVVYSWAFKPTLCANRDRSRFPVNWQLIQWLGYLFIAQTLKCPNDFQSFNWYSGHSCTCENLSQFKILKIPMSLFSTPLIVRYFMVYLCMHACCINTSSPCLPTGLQICLHSLSSNWFVAFCSNWSAIWLLISSDCHNNFHFR